MNFVLKTRPLVVLMLPVLFGLSFNANAGLIVEQVPVKGYAPAPIAGQGAVMFKHRQQLDMDSVVTPNITQAGVPPLELPAIRGAARGVSIVEAMRQLLPLGWKLFADVEINPDHRLNWSGSRNWVLVLNSVLVDSHLNAFIDWSAKEVTVLPGDVPKMASVKPAEQASPAASASPGESIMSGPEVAALVKGMGEKSHAKLATAGGAPLEKAPAVASAPLAKPEPSIAAAVSVPVAAAVPAVTAAIKPALPAAKVWRLAEDKSIRENFEEMAKQEGWRIVWSARKGDHIYDYPSTYLSQVPFTGELMGNSGVLARVTAAFINSSPPLAIHFYEKNKVAEVDLYVPVRAPAASEQTVANLQAEAKP